ncbi:MAG: cyclic nucleotide-binding domain-containing protein [Candidatus Ozemobacteraceae bacterium]
MKKFAAGEPVFHQGELRQEFFGLVEGRFAKVRFRNPPTSNDLDALFAHAELLDIFEKPDQVFGEIEALLQQRQNYSVYALEDAEAVEIPVNADNLHQSIRKFPGCGLATCISLAVKLRDDLGDYSRLLREEVATDGLIAGAAADYMEAVHAIAECAEEFSLDDLMDSAMAHPSCTLSERVINSSPSTAVARNFGHEGWEKARLARGSIANAVMPFTPDREGVVVFGPGSPLCKRGAFGNCLFILREGIAEVHLDGGARIEISRPGSIIGEIAVLLNLGANRGICHGSINRTADVVCLTQVKALVVPLDHIETFLDARPDVLADLMLALTVRARETRRFSDEVQRRLRLKIGKLLRPFLEGHHELATRLESRKEKFGLDKIFRLTARRSREIFERFSATLRMLGGMNEPSVAGFAVAR